MLDLDHNEITHISSEAFDKAESRLAYLELDHNKLQHFPARFLSRKTEADFSWLVYFSVSSNNISYLPRNTIVDYPHLTILDVSNNKISSIHTAAFTSRHLKMIKAQGNALVNFTTTIPPSVEILQLSGNQLTEFNLTTLAPLSRVYVDLSNNKLSIPGEILDELCPSSIYFNFEGNAGTNSPEAKHCNRLWNQSSKTQLFVTNNRFDLTCTKPLMGCERIHLRLRYA